VFDQSVSQEGLFEQAFAPAVRSAVVEGKHALLFAYGMTGGGKTYTISGTPRQPGLLARSLAAIFSHLAKKNIEGSASGIGQEWAVSVTYVEIYNEAIYDLLSTVGTDQASNVFGSTAGGAVNKKRGGAAAASQAGGAFSREQLSILRDREGRGFVSGARQITVSSTEAVFSVLAEGAQNKTHAETALNSDSSRSHTVFSISIWRRDAAAMEQQASIASGPAVIQDIISPKGEVLAGHSLWSRISVVDLAGSERANRVNAGADGATTTKEAGKINNSLMVLMRCFEAMREKKKGAKDVFVRFRDSKLTYMFADYLGGSTSGSTVMIVNAGPGLADYDETLQAIKYAAVVKDVKVSKDRVVTRWEPGQYDKDGRKIKKGGKDAPTASVPVVGKNGKAALGKTATGSESQLSSTTSSLSNSGPIDPSLSAAIVSASLSSNITEAAAALETASLTANLAAAEEASAAANLAAAEASALLAEANEKIAAMEVRILELEDETSNLKEEASDLRASNRRLEEEAEDAHERADGIEEDVRDEMAASMEQQMRTVEQLWRAKLDKERTEANDKIAKLLMLQSVKSGKRGSSIAGLLKDLGISVSAEIISAVESKTDMGDGDEEEEEEEDEEEEIDEEKQELTKKVDLLEKQLSSTTTSLKRAELESSERERLAADARDAAAEAAEAAIEAKGLAAAATAKATRAEASLALQIANAEAQSMRFEELENDLKEQAEKVENSLRADIALLRKQTDAAAIAAEKDIVALRKEKSESETALQKKLDDEKKEFSGQLSKLSSSLASATSSRDTYKDESEQWQSKHNALAAAVDGYKGRISELEERCESFSKSSMALQQRLSAAKSGSMGDEFQAELSEVKSALEQSQSHVATLQSEISMLKSDVAEAKAKRQELDEKLLIAEEKISTLTMVPAPVVTTSGEISVMFEDFISSSSSAAAAAAVVQQSQEPELDVAADEDEKPVKEVKKTRSSRVAAAVSKDSTSITGVKRSRASSKAPLPALPPVVDEVVEETNVDEEEAVGFVDGVLVLVEEKPARKSRSSKAAPALVAAPIEKTQKASKVARGAGMRDASGAAENDSVQLHPQREIIASPSKAVIRSVASPRSAGVGPIMKSARGAPAALKSNAASSQQTVAGAAAKKVSVATAKAAMVTSDPFEFIASPQGVSSSMQEEVAPMQSKLKLPMAIKRKPTADVVAAVAEEDPVKPARSLRARK